MLSGAAWQRVLCSGQLGLGLVLVLAGCEPPPVYQRYDDQFPHEVGTGSRSGSGGMTTTGPTGSGGSTGAGSSAGAGAALAWAGGANAGGSGSAATGGNSATGGKGGMGGMPLATGGAGGGGAKLPGALVHCSFDESSGPVAHDDAGITALNGVLYGATFAAGHVGNAANLSGPNQYVAFPSGLTAGLSEMTVAFWMKMRAKDPFQRAISVGNSSSTGYWYVAPSFGPGGVVRFGITTKDWLTEQFVEGTAPPINEWKHVAVVLGAQGTTLYLDSIAVASSSTITLRPKDLGALPNVWLGRSPYANEVFYNGLIDDFVIFDRALSPSEIATLMRGL